MNAVLSRVEDVMKRTCALLLISALAFPNCAVRSSPAQPRGADPPELWRLYAQKLPVGSVLTIQTSDRDRFTASLLVVDDTGITVKSKTRLSEPLRRIAFDRLEQLELKRDDGPGTEAALVGVGIAVGAGVFLGILGLLCAALCGD
jgi:hypothetical protein